MDKFLLRAFITLICTLGVTAGVQAELAFKHGAVIARSLVLDKDGQPILVEFDSKGNEVSKLNLGGYSGAVSDLTLMSAAEYAQQVDAYEDFQTTYPELAADAVLMDRNQIESTTFKAADNTTIISTPRLKSSTKSALIRGQSTRYASLGSQSLILQEYPINIPQARNVSGQKTVVLNSDGHVITTSSYDVAYRVGFWGNANEAQPLTTNGFRTNDDEIFGPVPDVKVYVAGFSYAGGVSFTDEEGKYSFRYLLPPCPIGGFDYTTDVWAELRYQNFLPTGSEVLPYYLRKQEWTYCYRKPHISALPFVPISFDEVVTSTNYQVSDLYVDVMFVTGDIRLANADGSPVAVESETQHLALEGEEDLTSYLYDFNSDGQPDTVVKGKVKTITLPDNTTTETFVAEGSEHWDSGDEVEQYGIYFDAGSVSTSSPDLVRVADHQKRIGESAGELKSISQDDFKNTDILIFRESTGDLIVERRGLRDAEVNGRKQVGYDDGEELFSYRVMLRGPRDSHLNIGGGTRTGQSYEEFYSEQLMEEPFQQREANHPKPGEFVKVVAINRATGYTGTARVQLAGASENGASMLNVTVPTITMSPPHLKIWAERKYTVESGLTANEKRRYLVGNEGAATLDDSEIIIYSEWLDHDGSALPKDLGRGDGEQFGLTGRLAKVVAANTLGDAGQAAGGAQALFPIAPGRQTQAIKINDNLAQAEHYYIHVSGEQKAETPNFDTGSEAAPYDSRPASLTPFLTPLYDEGTNWLANYEYQQARANYDESQGTSAPQSPSPSYAWQYRPEYQFSQYGLEMEQINRVNGDGTGSTTSDNILDKTPVIASSDDLIEALYSLFASGFERLQPIDGEQQLILALGEDETLITVGEDQNIHFDNVEHLASLSPDDFLTMRLYANNDAANVLWEYAFDVEHEVALRETLSRAKFDDPAIDLVFGDYKVIDVPLAVSSRVRVDLLDQNRQLLRNLIPEESLSASANYKFVLLHKDIETIARRVGVDFHLLLTINPDDGSPSRRIIYKGEKKRATTGDMLGQIIQHDTLIQRGALSLSRQDIALSGRGPQLNFTRSYSNEARPENDSDPMGPGWSNNHNIFIEILSYAQVGQEYEDHLPGWIADTRDSLGPKLLPAATLTALSTGQAQPSHIMVSNGGSFQLVGNNWVSQRGNHGSLSKSTDGNWQYRSKDGTTYTFESIPLGLRKGSVKTIQDRNGNQLAYHYQMVKGERLVTSIIDAVGRTLTFNYGQSDNYQTRLKSVSSSVGIDLEFEYFPAPEDGSYDPRIGMLKSFKRDVFTEQYDYEAAVGDAVPNMSSRTDANGEVTAYEYYAATDVPVALGNYVAGLNSNDVMYRVHYPTASGDDFAQFNYPVQSSNHREVIDLRGNKTSYALNDYGNPQRIEEPEGKIVSMQWSIDLNEPDNVMRFKADESIGADWEYKYDDYGNLIEEIDPYDNKTIQRWYTDFTVLKARTDKNGNQITQNIDAKGNVTDEYQDGTVGGSNTQIHTRHTYNGDGERIATRDGRGNSTTFTYDNYGNLESITEPEDSYTEFANDSRGRQRSKTDANDHIWETSYDTLDRVVQTTDPKGNTVAYDYDPKGNKLQEVHTDRYTVDGSTYERSLTLDYRYEDDRDRVTTITRTGATSGLPDSNVSGNKTFAYDANSNLLSETDWKGIATRHTYDALNRRTGTINRANNTMSVDYDFVSDSGLRKTTKDYEDRVTVEHYDQLDRLTRVQLPQVTHWDGSTKKYERLFSYDKMDHVLAATDANGHLTQYEYDGRYLKTQQTDALSGVTVWEYDANGNQTASIDAESRRVDFIYDEQNRLVEKRLPEGHVSVYAYDANNNRISETGPWGYTTATSYDAVNQPNGRITPDGAEQLVHTHTGQQVYYRDAEGRSSISLYTADDLLVQSIDGVGRTTTYIYDDNDNRIETELSWNSAATGPDSVKTRESYDALDRRTGLIEALGSLHERSITYGYDKTGNLVREERPAGRIVTFAYDALNRRISATDAENNVSLIGYDGVGNQTLARNRRGDDTVTEYDDLNRPVLVTDALMQTTRFAYDKVGNLRFETDKRGTQTEHQYDDLNRLVASYKQAANDEAPIRLLKNDYDVDGFNGHREQVTDANGNSQLMVYNWRGQVTQTDYPAGQGYAAVSSYASYDGSGWVTSSTDEVGYVTRFTYFDDGSTRTVTNAENEQTTQQYDLFGNVAITTRPKGAEYVEYKTYDTLNRLATIENALGHQTRYEYDSNNNLVNQYMPAAALSGEVRVEYEYDLLNRRTAHIQHKSTGNLITTYDHDAEGNVTFVRDAKGQEFSNDYDKLNRLVQQNYPAGSDITRIITAYDANNNVDTITENKLAGTEITDHDYDLLDRLISTGQRGLDVNYQYDDNGNRTLVSSDGGSTQYSFDARNRLATAVSTQGTTTYHYLANGWKREVLYPNDTRATYTIDKVGRIDTIANRAPDNSVISSFDYAYDDNGNRTHQIETQNGFASQQQQTTAYRYDGLDRMSGYLITDQASGDTVDTAYTFYASYDRATEVVTETVAGVEAIIKDRALQYDETFWVTQIDDHLSGEPIVYSYDDNGNTLSKLDNTQASVVSTVYDYNSRNQLSEAAVGELGSEVNQGRYDYNYRGMRIRSLGSERGDVEYFYDGDAVLEERDSSTSALLAHYRYADRLLSLNTPADSQFYLFASLGTTANLADASGDVAVSYRVDPYGEITHQEGSSVNRQVFTGQEHDENTGLIYFGARYYDPDIARFISQDTYLGEPGTAPSLHRYLYAYGNPTAYIDPDGREPVTLTAAAVYTGWAGLNTAFDTTLDYGFHLAMGEGDFKFKETIAVNFGVNMATAGVGNKVKHAGKVVQLTAKIGTNFTGQYAQAKYVEGLSTDEALISAAAGTVAGEAFERSARAGYRGLKNNFGRQIDAATKSVSGAYNQVKDKIAAKLTREKGPVAGGDGSPDVGNSVGAQADAEIAVATQKNLGRQVSFDGYRFYDPQYGLFATNPANTYRFSDPSHRSTVKDAYFGGHPSTAFEEVRGNAEGNIFRGEVKANNVLDLTDPDIRNAYDVDLNGLTRKTDSADYDYTNDISNRAYDDGYSGIQFPSSRAPDKCLVLFCGRDNSYETKNIFDVPVDHKK